MLGFWNPLTIRNLTTVMSYRYNNTTTAPLIPLDDAVAVVASLLLLLASIVFVMCGRPVTFCARFGPSWPRRLQSSLFLLDARVS